MITFKHSGTFNNIEKFFSKAVRHDPTTILNLYGQQGVLALASATPKDTGLTANSWDYEIKTTKRGYTITWTNSNILSYGIPVVMLIQYGHGTRDGTYIEGHDFINPVMKPIFDKIAENLWKEINSL